MKLHLIFSDKRVHLLCELLKGFMNRVSLKDARRMLGDLIRAVEKGESVVITRHGKDVARIVTAEPPKKNNFPDLTEFRNSFKMSGPSLTDELLAMRAEERG